MWNYQKELYITLSWSLFFKAVKKLQFFKKRAKVQSAVSVIFSATKITPIQL